MQTIQLSEQEAKIVMQALDITVKQMGLTAAVTLLPIAQSIERQLAQTADVSDRGQE